MSQTQKGPGRGSSPSTPRWVKVFGIIALILVLLIVVVLITGLGGDHGPRRHTPSGDAGSQTPLSTPLEEQALSGGDLADHTSRYSLKEHGGQPL